MSEARRVKGRTGCANCKIRRVKCDEVLPACRQCMRHGIVCPGYQKPLKWKTYGEQKRKTAPRPAPASSQGQSAVTEPLTSATCSKQSERGSGARRILPAGIALSSNPKSREFACRDVIPSLEHRPTRLVKYYFSHTCRLLSSFDSHLNPFRTIVADMIGTSKIMYLLVQATSAAQFSNQSPNSWAEALALQTEAFEATRHYIAEVEANQSSIPDDLMLGIILHGLTSAWYEVSDVGSRHVLAGQTLILRWLESSHTRAKPQTSFILGTFVYWEMLYSFVSSNPEEILVNQEHLESVLKEMPFRSSFDDKQPTPGTTVPHPLSGFSIDLFMLVGKLGSICRMRELMSRDTAGDLTEATCLRTARELETALLVWTPSTEFTNDTHDISTSSEHIHNIAEAYRRVALLQLYSVFPQLLRKRMPKVSEAGILIDSLSSPFGALALEQEWTGNVNDEEDKEAPSPLTASPSTYTDEEFTFLRSLALYALDMLQRAPDTSGTRTVQPLAILIASSWLVLPRPGIAEDSDVKACMLEWRHFCRSRMVICDEYIGLTPVSRTHKIMEETWRISDESGQWCNWMVAMHDKNWQTILG